MRYNVGNFNKAIELLKPTEPKRDELGGKEARCYRNVGVIHGLQRDKTSTYKQVIGDYVTVNTCYFIIRDIREAFPIDTNWRIKVAGNTYTINSVVVLDDYPPYYIELEATKLGGIA